MEGRKDPDRAEKRGRPERAENRSRSGRTKEGKRSEKSENRNRPERMEGWKRPDRTEDKMRPDRTEEGGRSERTEKRNQADRRNIRKREGRRKRKTCRALRRATGLLLVLAGLCIYLYPAVRNALFKYRSSVVIREFLDGFGLSDHESDALTGTQDEENSAFDRTADEEVTVYPSQYMGAEVTEEEKEALYRACFAYNCSIYAAGQSELKDAESYETLDLGEDAMELLSDGLFGYVEIPVMDVILPLYLGSSAEHMAAGAAVMGETSVPIGGLNTNSVISAHRGYRGSPYFREIEKLSVGDVVYLTNPWGTLTYTVSEIDIISPQNADAIKIRKGRDMITLLTCHPYRSGGLYRYVVYCDRADTEEDFVFTVDTEEENGSQTADSEENPWKTGEASDNGFETGTGSAENADDSSNTSTVANAGHIVASDGTVYASSEKDIRTERMLRLVSGIFLTVLFCVIFLYSRKHRRKVPYNK